MEQHQPIHCTLLMWYTTVLVFLKIVCLILFTEP